MISKTAEYALRAIARMASSPDNPLSADFLSENAQIPRRYLNRVLQQLCAAGLVRSRPGPGGGYELNKVPGRITILDVVNSIDPIERIKHCPLSLKSHKKLCPLHAALDRAYAATEKAFASVSIQDLVDSKHSDAALCAKVTK